MQFSLIGGGKRAGWKDAWLNEAGLWLTSRRNMIELEAIAELLDLRWWFSVAGALVVKLNATWRKNYFTVLICFSFHFLKLSAGIIELNPPFDPAFLYSFGQIQHVPFISAIMNTGCWLLSWLQMNRMQKSCVSTWEGKFQRKILIFAMTNLYTYSPTVLSLWNAHHLQTICALGDLKLGYLSGKGDA